MTEPQKPQSGKPTKSRSHWFWLALVVLVLVLVPALVTVSALLALRSETGTAWVIDRIPGLEVTQGQGSLLGSWQARDLLWRGYGVSVRLAGPRIEWSPSCLLGKQLCIDTLQADQLSVEVQPSSSETPSESDFDLPDIDIPLGLAVRNLDLGSFQFNGSKIWDRLELAASGSGASWQLERAGYVLDDYRVTGAGHLETRGDWPLDLTINGELPPPAGDHWGMSLGLSGSVRDLRITGASQGYMEGSLEGRVSPLERALPAQLRVVLEPFRAHDDLPDTLVLHGAVVEAGGSLASGFLTRTTATLEATEGPVSLVLNGRVTANGARDLKLVLSPEGDAPAGQLEVTGALSWAGGLNGDARVLMENFPWYSLVPDMAAPEVELVSLDATLGWRNGQYQASIRAAGDGPLGAATLSTRLDGDLEQVRLSQLRFETGAGSLTGSGRVDYSGSLSWQGALQLENFNPGYWLPVLESSVTGSLETTGSLGAGAIPEVLASWDLAGSWRSRELTARGAIDTRSGGWELSGLDIAVGKNRMSGNGYWGKTLEGDLLMSLPQPDQLMPGLSGQASARVSLSGTPDQPEGQISVRSERLSWQDALATESLTVDGALLPGLRLETRAQATGVSVAGQHLDRVDLALVGTGSDHKLSLSAAGPELELGAELAGGFDTTWTNWQGALNQGVLGLPEQKQQWSLQSPIPLAYAAGGELSAGAHCWAWQDSSVCAGPQRLLPDQHIAYTISNFPASALAPLMPDNLRWLARIDGDLDVTMAGSGPEGRVRLDAGRGSFQVLRDGEWQELGHELFTVSLNLKPEQADLDLDLSGPALGLLSVQASVDPLSPRRTVTGRFRLDALDLALAGLFSGLEEASGEVNGEGRFSGPLLKPEVFGELALTRGHLMDPSLPVPMDKVNISLELRGYQADILGRIQANERSEAVVTGQVNWAEAAPEGSVTVTGDRLPFSLEPSVHLELAPDLTLAFRQGELNVSGQVSVPRGSIEIKGLPEQAVSVSDDEVIVGEEKNEPVIRSLNMDVRVLVGEDKVTFSAFGLTGDLEGALRIGNDMDTRGTLQLVNGNYDAYGQELELSRARLIFVGNLTQPYLDIEAVRTVDTVVAGLRLSGSVLQPETEVFSVPDMPQTDALSYIILGRAPESRSDEGQMSRAALSLGLTQASKVTGRLGEELGIRNLTLEAEGSGDDTAVVASGYLTDELSIRYGIGVFEQATTVALRYDLGRYFYLEAASGLAASLDIFYTRDF